MLKSGLNTLVRKSCSGALEHMCVFISSASSVRCWQPLWTHTLCLCEFYSCVVGPKSSFWLLQPQQVRMWEKAAGEWRDFRVKRKNLSLSPPLSSSLLLSPPRLCRAAPRSLLRWWQRLKSRKATFPGFPEAFLGTVHLPSSRGEIIFCRLLGKLSLKGLVFKICV